MCFGVTILLHIRYYYRLYAMFLMVECVRDELQAMKDGLNDVIPAELLSGLTAEVSVRACMYMYTCNQLLHVRVHVLSYACHSCSIRYIQDFQLLLSGGSADINISRLKSVIHFNHTHGNSTTICDRFEKYA